MPNKEKIVKYRLSIKFSLIMKEVSSMSENKKVHYIPVKPPKRDKRVGIYCRVSSNSVDQLKSLTAQVSCPYKINCRHASLVIC